MNLDRAFNVVIWVFVLIFALSMICRALMASGVDVDWAEPWLTSAFFVALVVGVIVAIKNTPKENA